MAIDPTLANSMLRSQLAMHAVNDPVRVASLAASLGAIPPLPPVPAPTQVAQADSTTAIDASLPAPAPPAPPTPTSAQATAPPPPPVAPNPAVNLATTPSANPAMHPPGSALAASAPTPDGTLLGPLAGSPEVAPTDTGLIDKETADKLTAAGKALGALAPPKSPNPPPMVQAPAPSHGSYNPAVVADFLTALLGAQGGDGKGGGGLGNVSSLGKMIGG